MSPARVSFVLFESFQAAVVEPSFSALCVWYQTALATLVLSQHSVALEIQMPLLFSLKHCKQH